MLPILSPILVLYLQLSLPDFPDPTQVSLIKTNSTLLSPSIPTFAASPSSLPKFLSTAVHLLPISTQENHSLLHSLLMAKS